MKLAILLAGLLLPVLASASATHVSLPLTSQQESTVGNFRDCSYERNYHLGSGDALSPFQVFTEDERGIYRLVQQPLQQDEKGFYLRLYGYKKAMGDSQCPSSSEVLVVR